MKILKLDRFRIAMGAGILLAVVIVGGLGWAFFQQLALAEELRDEARQLEQAVATQRAHQGHLTATLTYVQTDQYVEEWAREEAKMVKPGEVLVLPIASSAGAARQPTPTAQPADAAPPVPEDQPFWLVWWHAFTGSGP
jgi:cell division protein FtsB